MTNYTMKLEINSNVLALMLSPVITYLIFCLTYAFVKWMPPMWSPGDWSPEGRVLLLYLGWVPYAIYCIWRYGKDD